MCRTYSKIATTLWTVFPVVIIINPNLKMVDYAQILRCISTDNFEATVST